MDWQILFNIAFGICGFLGGWVLTRVTQTMDRLDKDVRGLPHLYVSKDDFKEAVKDLKEDVKSGFSKIDGTLATIFSKLDRKEDRT